MVRLIISIFFIFLLSCNSKIDCDNCIYKFGKLLLDKEEIDWGDISWDKEYYEAIKIYNPTNETIHIGHWGGIYDIWLRKDGSDINNWRMSGFTILPKTCEEFEIVLNVGDNLQLGRIFTYMRFTIDGNVLYTSNIEMEGNVVEDFSHLSEEQRRNAPSIEVSENTFDFGTIEEGETVSHVFNVKNTGIQPLILRKIDTACGCTTVAPGQRMINGGQSIELEVTFNSRGRTGVQNRVVTIYCNDPLNSIVKLTIKGVIN